MYWEDVDNILYVCIIVMLIAGIIGKIKERKNDKSD